MDGEWMENGWRMDGEIRGKEERLWGWKWGEREEEKEYERKKEASSASTTVNLPPSNCATFPLGLTPLFLLLQSYPGVMSIMPMIDH